LSSSLGNLTALTELRLGGNELTALPDWLGNLTALRTLHLGGTGLAAPELA
jgi:Leucine-rich repeat (LRR) protein